MRTKTFKRFLLGVLVVVVWLSFVVEGSYALLFDSSTLDGNTISTGGIDLQISNSQDADSVIFADTRPGFSVQMKPGDVVDQYFFLKNTGSAGLDMNVSMQLIAPDMDLELANLIGFSVIPVDAEGNQNGEKTITNLQDIIMNNTPLNGVIPAGETQRYMLRIYMDPQFSIQNFTMNYDLVFKGTQVAPPTDIPVN